MGMTAPSQQAQKETGDRLKAIRFQAQPLTAPEIASLEEQWARDGMHHHMGATDTVHRLLATIASLKKA